MRFYISYIICRGAYGKIRRFGIARASHFGKKHLFPSLNYVTIRLRSFGCAGVSLCAAVYKIHNRLTGWPGGGIPRRGGRVNHEVNCMKRILAGTMSACLLLAAAPAAQAANDLEGNWAKTYIEYLGKIPYNGETGGVIRPNSATGNYDPDKQVTRAEFMRYINRAFNFTEKAPVTQYTDLSANGWYMDSVQIAAKHGYISGTSATEMSPNAPITREQVISVLGRLFKKDLDAVDPESLRFSDNKQIGKWSAAYIKDAVDAGIVRGYTDGSFKPAATVTRAEIASLLYHYMGTSLNTEGTVYNSSSLKEDTKNVTISAPCTLQNTTVEGDLYITEGVSGTITLTNVVVRGDLIQSGGSLVCNGVSSANMVIDSSVGRLMQATASGNSEIRRAEVRSSASLFEKDLTGQGFVDVILAGGDTPSLTFDGTASVTAAQKSTVSTTTNAVIDALTANAPVTVGGYGAIRSAVINAPDCSLAMTPQNGCVVKTGLTATVAGKEISGTQAGSGQASTTPSAPTAPVSALPPNSVSLTEATFDRNPDSDAYEDLEVSLFAVDDAVFRRVVLGGVEVDASFSRSTIRIDAEDLAEIYPGVYTLTYVMSSGVNPTLQITIVDTGDPEDPYDYESDWTGNKRDDVEFRTDKNSRYSSKTSISSIKYNGNNVSSKEFKWKVTSAGRLEVTIDGEEVSKWFDDLNNPDHLDFDIKLNDPSETFVLRIWNES